MPESTPHIELDEYEIKPGEFFRISLRAVLKNCFWIFLYVVMVQASVVVFLLGELPPENIIFGLILSCVLVGLLFLWWVGCSCWIAYSRKSRTYLQRRKMFFDEKTVDIRCEDGSNSHLLLENFFQVFIDRSHYFLFINQVSMIPVPFSAFRNEEDRRRFEEWITERKVKLKRQNFRLNILIFLVVTAILFSCAILVPRYCGSILPTIVEESSFDTPLEN